MTIFYHYTDEDAYSHIVRAATPEGQLRPSGVLVGVRPGDLAYGTGWYVTPLPPTTPTDELLRELWQSDRSRRERTSYWLELVVHEAQVEHPDPSRPSVALIPYFRRDPSVDGPSVSVVASVGRVLLREAGRRAESANGGVKVTSLFRPAEPRIVVEATLGGIFGIRSLNREQRQAILDWYKIEDPNDSFHIQVERLIDKSDALYRRGELEEALAAIEAAIELESDLAIAWTNKGAILAGLGRRVEALAAYDRAIEIDPEYWKAYSNAAASLVLLGRHREALNMCERGLKIDARNAELLTNMGVAHRAIGNEDEALRAFEKALE